MKFYNRTEELAELQRIKKLSFTEHSRMTVITGRRRIGKTSLIMKSVENEPTVYLFVGRKTEAALCSEYINHIANTLNVFVPNEIASFRNLFQDYNVLKRIRPIGSKEGSQTIRYEITDNFLQFWFNYFDRHRAMVEIKNFVGLQNIIKADYIKKSQ